MKVFPIDLEAKPRPYYAQAYNDKHHGTDIFAPKDTNVFAVEDGQVRKDDDPKGGIVAYLTTLGGWRYYYAHLNEFIGASPRTVKTGEVIGTVGNTGNAAGKAPHVHLQVALPEVGTVDPYPFLLDVDPARASKQPPKVQPVAKPAARAVTLAVLGLGALAFLFWTFNRTKSEGIES